MKVITETCRGHFIRYLSFYLFIDNANDNGQNILYWPFVLATATEPYKI
jgi:hypothetical protein